MEVTGYLNLVSAMGLLVIDLQENGRKSIQEIIRKMKHSTLSSTRETHSSTRYDKMHVIIGFISFVFLRQIYQVVHMHRLFTVKKMFAW